jgi:hypothetical protein
MQTEHRERERALAHLHTFGTRILPGTLRRIASWKQLGRGELPELRDELLQELAVDCLQHAPAIVSMPAAQRHGRWMRLAERWVYRHHLRPRLPAALPTARPRPAEVADDGAELPALPEGWVRLANGRWNLSASAVRDGRPVAELRSQLEQLVVRLGCDGEHDAFWRARLAEALTGLAADLLRQRRRLHLLSGPRCRPDPERRLERIRSLARHFHLRPSTIDVRRLVRHWTTRPRFDADAPRRLLGDAVRIWPRSPVALAWLAEESLTRGDLAGALAAVRRQRELPSPPRARTTLVRARVLEMRGRWHAAVQLLRRARRRWPGEPRLRRALAMINA